MLRSSFRGGRLLSLPLLFCLPLPAHDPITTRLTWTQEISRIVYKHCAECHREQGKAMPLITYEQARPWAKAIRDEVASRRMPPWGAVPGVGSFRGDRSLSGPEIDMLISWVEGGAPEGDRAFLASRIPSPTPAARVPAGAATLDVNGDVALKAAAAVVAIQSSGALEAWATRADGSVERLIRIPEASRYFHGPFVFETPLRFAAGTRIHTTGKAVLYLRK